MRAKNNTQKVQSYWEYKNITIYNQDFLKFSALPESSIDLIFTTPPYNVDIHYHSHKDNLLYKEYLEFRKR